MVSTGNIISTQPTTISTSSPTNNNRLEEVSSTVGVVEVISLEAVMEVTSSTVEVGLNTSLARPATSPRARGRLPRSVESCFTGEELSVNFS